MATTQITETVTLSGQTFTVERFETGTINLVGKRGGEYFLRPFLGEDDGLREVISWKSGAPLRDKAQRAIRVYTFGEIIEEVAR